MSMVSESEYLLTSEVGRLLGGLSADRVRALERAGQLPAVRTPSGTRLYPRLAVEALKRERELRKGDDSNGH